MAETSFWCFAVLIAFLSGHAVLSTPLGALQERQKSSTDYCKRWSHQSALVNGTLYLYGGRATTDASQTTNEWNNDFLSVDLDKTWQISTPSMSSLAQPSGPPAVANGYLWASYESLYLYGGEYSDTPAAAPQPFTLWEYTLKSSSWNGQASPRTSAGSNSAPGNVAVQRAAEGAGFSVAALGRGWYFGGHQDGYTTSGWSQSVPRIYLKSLLEYTFPGRTNDAISAPSNDRVTGSAGVWRNVTEGGVQDSAGFPERADGVLVYVPGFGAAGVLLGLAGGTSATYSQLNMVDVYDIANSTWYRQATTGRPPKIRVNPCAVVAAAADGSSYNVHLWGGQNLQPAGEQTQYDDMWILSVPSFTWVFAGNSTASGVAGRSGHTCNVWDGQMVVAGGYVGPDISCDSPGIYVFDLSSLKWENSFSSRSKHRDNPLSQQSNQMHDAMALQGSYGYEVPSQLQSVIGGGASGGATLTVPVVAPTRGPLATGSPATYTVSGSGSASTSTSGQGNGAAGRHSGGGSNVGAIVAGVIAGVLGVVAIYLGFCAWLYRKRLRQHQKWLEFAHDSAVRNANEGVGVLAQSRTHKEASGSEPTHDISPTEQLHSPHGSPGYAYSSSDEDLLDGREPTFFGIMLHPRRSLRVVNH